MYEYTCIYVLEIRLDNDEDDNVVDGCCCCEREDILKKNERKRVNFLLCVVGCLIDDLVFDAIVVEHVNSLVFVKLTIGLLLVDDTGIVRDVDNDDGIVELY